MNTSKGKLSAWQRKKRERRRRRRRNLDGYIFRCPELMLASAVCRRFGLRPQDLAGHLAAGRIPGPVLIRDGVCWWASAEVQAHVFTAPSSPRETPPVTTEQEDNRPPDRSAWACWVPTEAAPGSEGKVQTLAERARLRLPLFHPQDGDGPAVGHALWQRLARKRTPRIYRSMVRT